MKIDITRLLANPMQPRQHFDPQKLDELADSIRSIGQINPITVEQHGDAYIIIDGERRWRACQQLGFQQVDVHIRDGSLVDKDKLIAAMVTNIQRADLDPIEEAKGYKAMLDMGLSQTKIARQCGTSQVRVNNRVSMLRLEEPIQEQIAAGNLPMSDTVLTAILSIPDPAARVQLALKLAERRAGVKTILTSCCNLREALAAQGIDKDEPAALRRAYRKQQLDRPKWDALQQAGAVPPWNLFTASVKAACAACSIGDHVDSGICKTCPVVVMVETALREVKHAVVNR